MARRRSCQPADSGDEAASDQWSPTALASRGHGAHMQAQRLSLVLPALRAGCNKIVTLHQHHDAECWIGSGIRSLSQFYIDDVSGWMRVSPRLTHAAGRCPAPVLARLRLHRFTAFWMAPAIDQSSGLHANFCIVGSTGSTYRTSTPSRLNIVTGLPPSTPHIRTPNTVSSFPDILRTLPDPPPPSEPLVQCPISLSHVLPLYDESQRSIIRMAYPPHSRALMAELGGRHMQDHKLVFDAPAGVRSSDQRSTSSDAAAPNGTNHSGGRGSGQATTEDAANEDDEEDSSSSHEDEEDEPEVFAPSHGRGKGKGKRPSIRVEPVEDEESQNEDEEVASHETGLNLSKHPVNQLLTSNKKRTFSNVSNTSVLFGDDQSEQHSFPRRKVARKLSNGGLKPLLKYKENANEDMDGFENAIETDDEDYSGVNLVPDDDESELNFEEQEESYIIQEEEQQATALISQYNDARRLSLDSHASDDIFNLTAPLGEIYSMDPPGLNFSQFFEPEALPASPDPSAKRKYSDSSTKRVRFDDEVQVSDSSSTSSSELDSTLYPDLFLDQDKLPPSLTQLLEHDHDEDNGDYDSPASEMSFWDFGQEEAQTVPARGADDFDELSEAGSSGYETDMGDTTDEYESDVESVAHPQTPLQKKSVLRRPSSAPGSKASSPKPFERTSRPTGRAIPPTRGIFIHDDRSKAIAVTNRTTKTLTFYRPRATMVSWISTHGTKSSSTSTANNSPRTSMQQLNGSDSEVSNEVFSNPFTTDIMLTGIFGSAPTDDFFFGAESIGPPEAFYPFVSIGANGTIMDDEDDYEDEDSQEDLNITDFMDFGDDADDTDVEQEDEETDVPATPATSMLALNGSTPAQPTPMTETPTNRKRNTSDVMLQHFDRGVVTAFRNNQNRYRDLSCLPSDPTIRASVSRPIRSGKSAETVMTPLRKRSMSKRAAKSPYQASSPMVNASSPLSGVTKASSRLHNSVMSSRRVPRMGTFP
ncbi:hypothetical protein K458DRAFT_386282 [Lentithecium fluviatile CBS 122367]|uniref:Uncharacterized protein n=1 Tax=Lentithecium fluviatile CBS 122367 TaxID=1168545 RepID=A0A6G1JAA8_9PLEO|nr:hypothetical protein K458DRAFT_386282 [Lentithecium fluviatile CBS 122367]